MPTNGDHVTRAELYATVKPIQSDVSEIKADVKTLLSAQAGEQAVRLFLGRVVTVSVALVSGAAGSVVFALVFHI